MIVVSLFTLILTDEAHRSVPVEKRLRFQIIEKVRTDDLPSQDPGVIRKRRMDRELYWISCLRSVYPLGLNDKVEGFGMHGNATDVRFSDYNMYSVVNFCGRSRVRNSRNRHGRKRKGGIQGSDFVDFRNLLVSFDGSELGRIESLIQSKQRRFLEKFISSHLSDGLDRRVLFLLRSRVDYSHRVRPTKKEVPSLNWSLDFQHKIFSDVNVRSILNSVGVKCLLPSALKGKFDVKLVYKYGKTIGSWALIASFFQFMI